MSPDPNPVKTLKSVQFEYPFSEEVFPNHGEGTEEINYTCIACHSADQVTFQPFVARAQWTETVERMETA